MLATIASIAGPRRADAGHVGRSTAVAQAALEDDLAAKVQAAGKRPEGRLGGCPGAARAGVHGPRRVSFPGMQQMRRNHYGADG